MTKTTKLRRPRPVTIDFETEGIESRPHYPPKPVGVSVKLPGKRARYYAWGHPTGNNCTKAQGVAALRRVWGWKDGLLFQNGKFDVDVAEVHCGLKLPSWERIHDTLFLIFLDDPNQPTFSLKPSADRLLRMKPTEQDAVRDWLLERQPVPGVKISKSQSSPHYFGRYICLAPGDVVGAYADGDVVRTERLFELLWERARKRGMLGAYDRERRLMPILLGMERQGVPVDVPRLRRDVARCRRCLAAVDRWIIRRLGAEPDINLDSGEQLVAAAIDAKVFDVANAPTTPTGKFQTNKKALKGAITDPTLTAVLKYRTQLQTCLRTFMEPWLRTALESGGLIFTTWNQVKGDARGGGGNVGARTGRLSATPNFQNIPKEFAAIFARDEAHLPRAKRQGLPRCPLADLAPLPEVRAYVTAFEGEVLIDRDYSQQEPRILAHFDGGQLLDKYLADPWIDFHDKTREELAKAGLHYERKPVKNTGLGLIYGMGVGALAERNGMRVEEARKLKDAVLRLYPGLKDLYDDCRRRAREGRPVRTWGGREYHCEEPKVIEGRLRSFDYKMPNALIQGSAADCTKEAVIRHHEAKHRRTRLLLNTHDQLTASTPRVMVDREMEAMRVAMESVEFDVAMLTEGAVGWRWGELEHYDRKGKRVAA